MAERTADRVRRTLRQIKSGKKRPVGDRSDDGRQRTITHNVSFESDHSKTSPPLVRRLAVSLDDSERSATTRHDEDVQLMMSSSDRQVMIHSADGRLIRIDQNGSYTGSENLGTPTATRIPLLVDRSGTPDNMDSPSLQRRYSPSTPKNTDYSRRRSMYVQDDLTCHDLMGRAPLSSKDLVFGIPRPPERPPKHPRSSYMRKSKSTPNINKSARTPKSERKPRSKTGVSDVGDYLQRRRLSYCSDDEDRRTGSKTAGKDSLSDSEDSSDDSCVAWSDDDASFSSSASSPDDLYENLQNFKNPLEGDKARQIAQELLTSESSYVKKLEILNKARNQTKVILGNDVAKEMFPYINSIYALHKENLLPHFTDRLKKWEHCRQIADIMKTFAPFLKLYTDYVKNFDKALRLVDVWNTKSPDFSRMLKTLPANGPSLNLKVQIKSHMLEPVQRVPRYKLLLQQYCKEIPEDSEERADLQVALNSVSQAAVHFEEMMKHGSSMSELVELQRHIDCPVNLVSRGRQLVRQGKMGKVNATTGKVVSRYLFLFDDLFLVCSEQSFYIPGLQPKYKCRQLLEIDGMQVAKGDNLDVPNTFYVKTRKKAIELCASSVVEKEDWEKELWKVIGDKMRAKLARSNSVNKRRTLSMRAEGALGKEAPVWVHNSQVTMCMTCGQDFKGFKKKHHCRACGAVVCHRCSARTARLEYDDSRYNRVCDECYMALNDDTSTHRTRRDSLYKARSRELCMIKGYLLASSDKGRYWHRRWFEVHEGGILYCYKAQQDVSPVSHVEGAIPRIVTLGGIEVMELHLSSDKYYWLKEDSTARKLHPWVKAIKSAS